MGCGVIPIFVGLALIVNGVFVSKKTEKLHGHETDAGTGELTTCRKWISAAGRNQPAFSPGFSVTDETTERLKEPVQRKAKTPNAD